jgi:hypothetical protein
MIDNDGNPIDPHYPRIDNYGVPIDYNCHICDNPLQWLCGDWLCGFCRPLHDEEYEPDSEDLDPN